MARTQQPGNHAAVSRPRGRHHGRGTQYREQRPQRAVMTRALKRATPSRSPDRQRLDQSACGNVSGDLVPQECWQRMKAIFRRNTSATEYLYIGAERKKEVKHGINRR